MRRPDVFTLDYSHQLAQGLQFAWLGRRVGPYVDDVSIRRQNAEVVAGTGSIVDYYDGGLDWLRFIQSTGKLSVPAMSADVGACTVSFWLSGVAGSLYPRLFAINGATKIYGYHDKSTSKLLLNRNSARYTLTANSASQQHVAIVHDGTALQVYINGLPVSASVSTVTATTVSDGGFGNVILGGTAYADDAIAQPFFHNRALSPSEIALLADRTDPMLGGLVREVNPVAYFDFGGASAGTDNLTAADLVTGSPVLGAPALGQVHALTALDLVVGSPVLGTPALGQVHALTAQGLVVGAPVLGSPVLGQVHVLTANDLVVGSPVLGTPALTENASNVDALTALDLVVGSPVLGSPAFGQVHALAPLDLVVGSPVLGAPALSDGTVQPAPTQTGGGIGRKIFMRTDRRQEEDDLILQVINKFLEVV